MFGTITYRNHVYVCLFNLLAVPDFHFPAYSAVNFDEARFLTMLNKAEEFEAYLRAALQAKGVAAPQLPSSAELGWTADLPHPMAYQYPGSSDIDLLRHQAKQVGWFGPAPLIVVTADGCGCCAGDGRGPC
jgi:hypothetical protein